MEISRLNVRVVILMTRRHKMSDAKLISMEEFKSGLPPDQSLEIKKLLDSLALMAAMSGIRKLIHDEMAKDAKARYDSFITAGFSETQALELCREVKR
jgi:hypothetical protein